MQPSAVAVVCAILLLLGSRADPQLDISAFEWESNTLVFPGTPREAFQYDLDPATDIVYVLGGLNSLASGTYTSQIIFPELWALQARGGQNGSTWTNLTPLLLGLASLFVPQVGVGAILNSRYYSLFGRYDSDIYFDRIGPVWADTSYLTIFDLRTPFASVPVSKLAIRVGVPSRNSGPLIAGNASLLSPRFAARSARAGSLLYVLGGVFGIVDPRTADPTGATTYGLVGAGFVGVPDSFVVVDLTTGVAQRLATAGGCMDPASAPNGVATPVVFSSRGGARIHCWGGLDYSSSVPLDPTTLYTYTVADDAWTSFPINALQGLGYASYTAVQDGVLVIGGDTAPISSGAGIGDVTSAFLLDASVDPALIRPLPSAATGREDAGVAVLSTGQGVFFLGASYPNTGLTVAYGYQPATQLFTAFVPSAASPSRPGSPLAVAATFAAGMLVASMS